MKFIFTFVFKTIQCGSEMGLNSTSKYNRAHQSTIAHSCVSERDECVVQLLCSFAILSLTSSHRSKSETLMFKLNSIFIKVNYPRVQLLFNIVGGRVLYQYQA